MTVTQQAKIIEKVLNDWAQNRGGVASVVANIRDMWETAYKASDKPRILICFAGEQVREAFRIAAYLARVDRQWQVAVTRGRGFNQNRGSSLVDTIQNAEPFYDSVETVRDMIRSITNVSVEDPLDYKGIRPMQSGNLVIDGYIIEFSTASDLSRPQSTVNQPPV
jgi:hypothetical protein